MAVVAQWISLAIAAVLFLGAVVVYLRGSKDKGTIATLESNNEALKERVEILEDTIASDKKAKEHLVERVRSLERERDVLVGVANSREAIAELSELVVQTIGQLNTALGTHHDAAMTNMSTLNTGLGALHDDLTNLTDALTSKGADPK